MDKKAYHKVLFGIFGIILLSAVAMYMTAQEDVSTGLTGYVVHEEQAVERPIQDVVKDLEDAGFERVVNEPELRYTR